MISTADKIQRGMTRQLQTWRETVAHRSLRVGWKIGFNLPADQQRLNLPSAMIGYLSDARKLTSGQHYTPSPTSTILIEPETAIQMGTDVPAHASRVHAGAAIAGYAAALELVDTTRSVNDDIEPILSGNLFHDSVLLAEPACAPDAYARDELTLSLRVNGDEVRTLEQARVPRDFSSLILTVADILAAHGEQLTAGDWIITGAAAQAVPVKSGDRIALDMGRLGRISLMF